MSVQPAMRNQRIAPTREQVSKAQGLLSSVPVLALDWSSQEGQAFLAFLSKLAEQGVPVAWVAESLNLDAPRLYATLTRYRRQEQ